MKKLSIKIIILSRSRYDSIVTTKLFPDWVEVLVPESQEELYRQKIVNPILTTPDDVKGLGKLRNYCLDHFPEESVIMVDDDVNYFYRLTGEKTERITDPEEAIQIVINACIMARDLGCSVFGFSQTDIRKYKGFSPFALNGWIGTLIGINGRKYRFREDKFKVDIDYCLQSLLVDRIIWIDNRYYLSNNKDNNRGGNSEFRTKSSFDESVKSLKDKWGECIKVGKYKGQIRIALNFSRKQPLNHEGAE